MATTTSKGGRKTGPDLLASAASHDANRILSQLEHGTMPLAPAGLAAHWHGGWLGTVGALLGMMLLVLAWLAWDGSSEQLPATSAIAPAAVAVPQAGEPPAHGPAAAATIINEAQAAAVLPQAARTPPQKNHPAPSVTVARASAAKPSKRPAAAPAGDSDVTLLAAMVAHGQQPAAVRQEAARDVVLRQDEEETASLLQRCRQLGLIEGMLCRARICSGRWDSDPACH